MKLQQTITVYTVPVYVTDLNTIECYECNFFDDKFIKNLPDEIEKTYPEILSEFPYVITFDKDEIKKDLVTCFMDMEFFAAHAKETNKRVIGNINRTLTVSAYDVTYYNRDSNELEKVRIMEKNEKTAKVRAIKTIQGNGVKTAQIVKIEKVFENSKMFTMDMVTFYENSNKTPFKKQPATIETRNEETA